MKLEFLIFLLAGVATSLAAFSCKDQSGNDVDWWEFFHSLRLETVCFQVCCLQNANWKRRWIRHRTSWWNRLVLCGCEQEGSSHPICQNPGWQRSGTVILHAIPESISLQALAYTLQQYYDKQADKSIFHVMFNDEVSETGSAVN